ncbi:hypothetical protein LINPERHAP2_LOCUS30397 [Linum perenne]
MSPRVTLLSMLVRIGVGTLSPSPS